jgi:hypothetical protein
LRTRSGLCSNRVQVHVRLPNTHIYTALDGGIHRSTPFAYRESTEFYESLFIKDPIDSGVSVSSNQPGLVQSSTQQHGIAMNSWAASVRAFRSALRASRQCSRRIGNAGTARIHDLCCADGVQAAGVRVAARDGQRAPPLLPHWEEAAARTVQQRVANWPRRTIVTSRMWKSILNCDEMTARTPSPTSDDALPLRTAQHNLQHKVGVSSFLLGEVYRIFLAMDVR